MQIRLENCEDWHHMGDGRCLVNATCGPAPNGAPRRIVVLGTDVFYEIGSAIDAVVQVDLDLTFIAEA